MSKRHGQRERNECAEHDKAKGADNMTEDRAESMAKKIADGIQAKRLSKMWGIMSCKVR